MRRSLLMPAAFAALVCAPLAVRAQTAERAEFNEQLDRADRALDSVEDQIEETMDPNDRLNQTERSNQSQFGQPARQAADQTDATQPNSTPTRAAQNRAAQPGTIERAPTTGPREVRPGAARSQDQANQELVGYLAGKLVLANKSEVQVSQMAAQQSQNQQVQQFANRVAQDHEELNQQLQQAMPQLGQMSALQQFGTQDGASNRNAASRADSQNGVAQPRQGQLGTQTDAARPADPAGRDSLAADPQQADRAGLGSDSQTGERSPGQFEEPGSTNRSLQLTQGEQMLDGPANRLMQITARAAENHLRMTKQMLGEYKGQDFDMAFVGSQIAAHTWMLAELQALEGVGPQEFQTIVRSAETSVEQHLQQAKQLSKQLEGNRAQQPDRAVGARTTESLQR